MTKRTGRRRPGKLTVDRTPKGTKLTADKIPPGAKLTVANSPGLRRPRRFSRKELAKASVVLVDQRRVLLRCANCGQVWSPNLLPGGGRLPHNYWRCPNGCNADARR